MSTTEAAIGVAAGVVFAAVATTYLADTVPDTTETAPAAPSTSASAPALDQLTVASDLPMTGYSRDAFDHWTSHGSNCNTREVVLREAATGYSTDRSCRAVTGTWTDPYTGQTWRQASDLDIDHVVPLAEAWRSGASAWDDQRREAFANDLERPQLLAVEDNLNQSKGDRDPASWLPPQDACGYAQDWITVKHHYGLSVDPAERAALADTLTRCTPEETP